MSNLVVVVPLVVLLIAVDYCNDLGVARFVDGYSTHFCSRVIVKESE